jgi:hypothetical protein
MGEDVIFASDFFVDQMVLSFVAEDDVNLRADERVENRSVYFRPRVKLSSVSSILSDKLFEERMTHFLGSWSTDVWAEHDVVWGFTVHISLI